MSTQQQASTNPLKTRQDLATLFVDITTPLMPYFSEGNTSILLGNCPSRRTDKTAGAEAMVRILWGLASFTQGGFDSALMQKVLDGLKNAVDPTHPEYWGFAQDFDPRQPDLMSIGFALCMNPDAFWHQYDAQTQQNLYEHLNRINLVKAYPNNWQYFKVMVNLGFEKLGLPYDKAGNEEALCIIDDFYMSDGWYRDGANDQHGYDYYNNWVFCYFMGIYVAQMRTKDPNRCAVYQERISQFVNQIKHWFAISGAAVPYGRSLSFRFAQGACFAAAAYADVEAMPWGECKHLLLANLRDWMQRPIFERDGILSMGYGYQNGLVGETYSAPGSGYWAFMTFLVLALPETHPFWASDETIPDLPARTVQPQPGMLIQRIAADDHVVLFNGKQAYPASAQGAGSTSRCKYNKFVYSSHFGFSVERSTGSIGAFAGDGSLSLGKNNHYRMREKILTHEITESFVYSKWSSWDDDVVCETYLIPLDEWHIRLHILNCNSAYTAYEGGFCIERDDSAEPSKTIASATTALLHNANGCSVIKNLWNHGHGEVIENEVCTNLVIRRPFMPALRKELPIGTTIMAAAVFAGKNEAVIKNAAQHEFQTTIQNDTISVFCDDVLVFEHPLYERKHTANTIYSRPNKEPI